MSGVRRLTWGPSDLSFLAIIILLISQYFSFQMINEARVQDYINANNWYEASKQSLGTVGRRGSRARYRLRYTMHINDETKECDVIKDVSTPAAPILSDSVKVTPRGNACEEPYLTEFEFWPRFNAYGGLLLTALAGALLLVSSARHRQRVRDALARSPATP